MQSSGPLSEHKGGRVKGLVWPILSEGFYLQTSDQCDLSPFARFRTHNEPSSNEALILELQSVSQLSRKGIKNIII